MAPSTRHTNRASTPPSRPRACESDTPKTNRFFQAYDTRDASESITSISKDIGITHPTGLKWLRERELLGSPAYRRTRKMSLKLGRRPKVSKEPCQMLVSPSRNPVRNQLYEAQIQYYNLPVKKRALQRQLLKNTQGARRYKQAYIKKTISAKNQHERTEFRREHQGKGVDNFWQYIVFTDEAHIDPSSMCQGYILREQGHRYDAENIQERGEKTGVKLHIAAYINWHTKTEKLEFYNDENDYIEKPKRPPKPRKTMYESVEEFNARILEWNASLPHDKEVKVKGNAMTQLYYTERLLPVYINALQKLRIQELGFNSPWLFQEDGDPSHGKKRVGLAQKLKEANWVDSLSHPAQSPDLNPMEAVWNILKQRVRRRTWNNIEELKAILQEEWSKITMQEVRTRI